MQAKIAEVEARTAVYKARKELTEVQTKANEKKAEKMALEIERERVLIALCAKGTEALERFGNGQMIEADSR